MFGFCLNVNIISGLSGVSVRCFSFLPKMIFINRQSHVQEPWKLSVIIFEYSMQIYKIHVINLFQNAVLGEGSVSCGTCWMSGRSSDWREEPFIINYGVAWE